MEHFLLQIITTGLLITSFQGQCYSRLNEPIIDSGGISKRSPECLTLDRPDNQSQDTTKHSKVVITIIPKTDLLNIANSFNEKVKRTTIASSPGIIEVNDHFDNLTSTKRVHENRGENANHLNESLQDKLKVKRGEISDQLPQAVFDSKQSNIKQNTAVHKCVRFPSLSSRNGCFSTDYSSGHPDKSYTIKKKVADFDELRKSSNYIQTHPKHDPVAEKIFIVPENKKSQLNNELKFEVFKTKKTLSKSSKDENINWSPITTEQPPHSIIYLTNRGATMNIPKQIPLNPRESFLIQQQTLIPDKNKSIINNEGRSSILKDFQPGPSKANGVYILDLTVILDCDSIPLAQVWESTSGLCISS